MNLEKILKEYQLLSPYYYDNLFKSSVRDNGERIYLDDNVNIIL